MTTKINSDDIHNHGDISTEEKKHKLQLLVCAPILGGTQCGVFGLTSTGGCLHVGVVFVCTR